MRYTFLIGIIVFLSACKKDKFTSAPQITYKSINPNTLQSNIPFNAQVIPVLTLHLTDADGDLGFVDNKDTSYVFIKNLLTNKIDSLRLPDLKSSAKKYFEADVEIALGSLIESSLLPSPKIDTTFFEVYIQDFAKNKSNVIVTPDPVYFITP
ncbi:MAG: hypothetical protein IPJ81_04010 [Chitinophagaceae bacterium]|nr:hypothetical protein [Chitinophagaceae bacterium]